MCLLIHHPKSAKVPRGFINDVVSKNSDGFGVMFGDGKRVRVIRSLGNAKEIQKLYDGFLRGRDCVMHFRMRTHGAVNLDNCHPYKVNDGLYMAHNGILHIGNDTVPSMSDTWHLIEYYLKPMLAKNPDLIFSVPFQEMLGKFIGASNKLSFVHRTGKTIVINRSAGLSFSGMWLSNTYAWNPGKFGYKEAKPTFTGNRVYQSPEKFGMLNHF